jgi:hypothetical protein
MAKVSKPTQEDIDRLKEWIAANNNTVFTVMRHVSSSGMMREISVVIPLMTPNKDPDRRMSAVRQFVHPSYTIAGLLGRGYSERHGHNSVICKGCGMDMGFDLVYQLSQVLYGDGYKIHQEWI